MASNGHIAFNNLQAVGELPLSSHVLYRFLFTLLRSGSWFSQVWTVVRIEFESNKIIPIAEWKLGATASSSENQKIGQTFVQVKMVVQTGAKTSGSSVAPDSSTTGSDTGSSSTTDTVQIEMSIPKFYEFLSEMEKIKASLDHFK